MQYDKDVIYTLKVAGTTIINGTQYYLIENEGIKYKVKMLQFQQQLPVPEEVKCVVYGYDADDTPLFAQHKGEIARKLYTVGSTYSFVVQSKPNTQAGHRCFYYGCDANGLRVYIQVGMGKELTVGRNVRCRVKYINPDGNLCVVPVNQEADTETNFLTFDELLSHIHAETMPLSLRLDSLRSEPEDARIQQILKQYDNREGEWVLSYLNYLVARREKNIEEKNWERVCELIGYQRLITEWVLEDSLFLTFYSSSVVCSLREKGEREMFVCEAILRAIELIRTNAVNSFLEHIFAKIRTSGYLSDRYRKVELLAALFRLDETLADKHTTPLIEFCRYVACNDFATETNALMSVSELIKRLIEKNRTRGDSAPAKTMRLLAISLLLCYNRDAVHALLIQRIMLYRYASLVSPEAAVALVNKAYEALTQTNQSYRPEFTWEDIISFRPEFFITKLRSFMVGEGDKLVAQHVAKEGSRILLRNGDFALYVGCNPGSLPTAHYKIAEILSIFDRRITIYADKKIKPKSNDCQHIPALKSLWEELYRQLSRQLVSAANTGMREPERPSVGMRVKIKLKAYNSRYPLMMFADVVEPGYEGTGALMASEVSRGHIQSMDQLFYEGDTFEATVQKVESNGRLRFGISRELFEFVTGNIKFGQRVCARLVRVSKGTCVWICTEGYTLFSPSPSLVPEIGTVALLEVRDVNNAGYINAAYLEEVDENVNETEALAKLVEEYINSCSPQGDQAEEEETNFGQVFNEEDATLTGEQLSLPLIHELSWLLVVASSSEKSLATRYNLLGTARLLTKISDDAALDEYLSLLMDYEENIYTFATDNGQVRWSCTSSIDDAAVARYPALQPKKELLQILNMFHSHIFDSELAVNIATTKDQNKEHIIRLVLAHSLLYHTLPATALIPVRNELLQRIGAGEFVVAEEQAKLPAVQEPKEELTCLGRESDTMEFKSSIVYPAGRTTPDMKQQSDIILRTILGFLNASGGTLCIGVSDEGLAIGLKEDYSYMQCNSDGYERFIRQRIITSLGKDVNSLIKMEFPQYGSREICRVTVPCYGKLIGLDGVVWQRQGNSTVLLDGNALAKQQKRKNDTLQEELSQLSEKNLDLVSEGLQQAGGVQTAVAAAFAASLEKKKKKQAGKAPKNAIQTSLIRSNPLNGNGEDSEVVTYLSLLDNGGYILEDEYSVSDSTILTLAVKEYETSGSLLLCYENGFVNRVPLKILLQKKRNYVYKNGANKDSRLIFATVENGESGILVRTVRQKNEYLKMYPIDKLKVNMDLSLKGTPLFSYDFGKAVAWEVIPELESDKLEKLYNENLAHQGYSCNSEAIVRERELLRVMGWKVE